MAITLSQKVKIDLGGLVDNAISTVQSVRKGEKARKEAEFQKAIAEGTLSYDAQIRFREEQLREEKTSPIGDSTYVTEIEGSLGDLKRLKRFSILREKYRKSQQDYVAGKGNINAVIDILEDSFRGEQDETIKSELQTQLSAAIRDKGTLERSAIQNRITVAEKDKSVDLIDKSINEVKEKKSDALLADDEDTASMWDATLASLRSTRSAIKIENGVAEINYRINKDNLTSGDKLGLLNKEILNSDEDAPVVYQGVRYNSLKDFWTGKRGEYIRENYLEEVKKEIERETNRIATTSAFGQVPVERIKAIGSFYDDLAKRPEFQPYALEIQEQRNSTMTSLATELTKALGDEAAILIDRGQDANAVINKTYNTYQRLEAEVGIKLARPQTLDEMKAGVTLQKNVDKTTSDITKVGNFPVVTDPNQPKEQQNLNLAPVVAPASTIVPAAEIKPLTSPTPTPASTDYFIKRGDTLSALAMKNNTTVAEITRINQITDPNKIREGQVIRFK